MDRLADSLTVRVLRELGKSRPITAVRTASLGAVSLPALKAFLEGEQHFRRTEWDAAIAAYRRAIDLDSAFALALYRAGVVLGWQSTSSDSLSLAYLLRAAALNHGLPPRDSFLVLAESLSAALDEGPEDPRYWEQYRRLYASTAEGVRRYPNDPEMRFEYGDVRYHYSAFASEREMREAFDRAIALDSAYAPAYIHIIELANQLGDPDGARRYLDRYLALRPTGIYADAGRLARRLLDPLQARSPQVRSVLDTASSDLLLATIQSFRGWADTLETNVRLARRMVAAGRDRPTPHGPASPYLAELGSALAYHGRTREAFERAGSAVGWLFVTTAWMGGVPPDTAATILRWSLAHEPLFPRAMAVLGAPWWAERRDTLALTELMRRADSLGQAGSTAIERTYGHFAADGARALRSLARGDTAAAVRGLLALSDTACQRCTLYTIELARLLDARRLDAEAARLLARDSPGYVVPTDGFWELYRARLAARRGDRVNAARSYRFVRDVWVQGDPALQPFVREASAVLRGLRRQSP
jgi:serine/threonine-protein kinase